MLTDCCREFFYILRENIRIQDLRTKQNAILSGLMTVDMISHISSLSMLLHSAIRILIWVLLGVLLACNNPRRGALSPQSRTALENYAARSTEIQKKYYFMVEKVAQLLSEAAAQDDRTAMAMIDKFVSDNQAALDQIAADFDGWQQYADHDEVVAFAVTLNKQSYTKRLRRLVPAFRKRISYNDAYLRRFESLMWHFDIRR